MHHSLAPGFGRAVRRLCVLLSLGFVLAAGLDCSAERPKDPFQRSTVFMAKYKGELRPVIAVKGDHAQVMVGEKQESIPDDVGFLPFRGKQSIDAFVDVLDQQAGTYQVNQIIRFENGGEVDNGPISRGSAYECTLLSDKRVQDCYIVILLVDRDFLMGQSNELRCHVVLHNVGTLEAGKKKKQNISFGFLNEEMRRKTVYCPVLFSHGVEVKTTLSFRSDQILARIEALQHASIVAAYLEKNKGADHKLRIYQQSSMVMPEGTNVAALPESVTAMFTVDGDGKVQAVQVRGDLPVPVKRALIRNIENWLFLPALEKGYPKNTPVQVPIRLREPAAASS